MTPRSRAGLLAALLALATASAAYPASERARVAVEVEAMENTLDGCTNCGCRVPSAIETGKEQAWWVSFGVVKAGVEKGWEPVGSASRCGTGSFEKVSPDFARTIGTPYVILDLSSKPALTPAGRVELKISIKIRKLNGFDTDGHPAYATTTQIRMLSVTAEGDLTIPVLIPDEHEREAFAVDEVFARVRAQVVGKTPPASYGSVVVTADVPGAEILLDGGQVGRTTDGSGTIIQNVLTGRREVRVRDFSGREARQQVLVEKGKTIEVALKVLDLASARGHQDLIPIGKNPQGHEEYWRVKDGAIMVRVPAGEFTMGSPEGQGDPPERPQHKVFISEFMIDKTEVTWRQYRRFADAEGKPLPPAPIFGTPDDYAVTNILWDEAKAYCEWVGGRLPTEAEWEKAARGTDGRTFPWGNEWEPGRCNGLDGGPHRPEAVGHFQNCLSPYGVLEMAGGAWEWCGDGYGEAYYADSPARDPAGFENDRMRVLRGGSWLDHSGRLRSALRHHSEPTWRNVFYGLRCVREMREPS